MAKIWNTPVGSTEVFTANDSVATCGYNTVTGNYNFVCDAPAGTLYYYQENGTKTKLGNYEPCSDTHKTKNKSDFVSGFVDYNGNKEEDDGEAVTVWLEKWYGRIYDAHATKNLDQEFWDEKNDRS